MKTGLLNKLLITAAVFALGVAGAASTGAGGAVNDAEIAKKMTHEIRMYSRYTIWDNVNFRVDNGNITLLGQVSQPFKKNDIGRIAKGIPGVATVTNDLQVLPLSPMDDRLRLQVARAIYRDSTLSRFGLGALPSIHIIVDNGHVTLEGVVDTRQEKDIAGIRASGAGLSFGAVTNNLLVANPKPHKG